jgi:hypothetical protein
LKDLGVDGWIILNLVFKRWYGSTWTGFIWLRRKTGAGSGKCSNKPDHMLASQ